MAYSTVLELFGAIERGRLDPQSFHNTCSHFLECLESIRITEVAWFVDVDHVYAESKEEGALFEWVSLLCEAGAKIQGDKKALPWTIRGSIVDGDLGMKSIDRGLTTATNVGVFAELRTSLRSFNGIGVRVSYVPESASAKEKIFSNVLWTGHSDLPYVLFTDIRPEKPEVIGADRLKVLAELAMAAAGHSKTASRCYVPAITRILLNNESLDLESTVSVLSAAKSVEGIELAGLMLIDRAYESNSSNPSVSEKLVSFPRLSGLCKTLQENHAFPIGLVRKEAIGQYLREAAVAPPVRTTKGRNKRAPQ